MREKEGENSAAVLKTASPSIAERKLVAQSAAVVKAVGEVAAQAQAETGPIEPDPVSPMSDGSLGTLKEEKAGANKVNIPKEVIPARRKAFKNPKARNARTVGQGRRGWMHCFCADTSETAFDCGSPSAF